MVTAKATKAKTQAQMKAARSAAAKKAAATRRSNAAKSNNENRSWKNGFQEDWSSQTRWQGQMSWNKAAQGLKLCAYADIGFGNQLYIRGEGCGLSWERGVPMQCEGSHCWCWQPEAWAQSQNAGEMVQFKVLINDETWCDGQNCCVNAQCSMEWNPCFSESNEWQGNCNW